MAILSFVQTTPSAILYVDEFLQCSQTALSSDILAGSKILEADRDFRVGEVTFKAVEQSYAVITIHASYYTLVPSVKSPRFLAYFCQLCSSSSTIICLDCNLSISTFRSDRQIWGKFSWNVSDNSFSRGRVAWRRCMHNTNPFWSDQSLYIHRHQS